MKKMFKKVLLFILAAVMTVGCLYAEPVTAEAGTGDTWFDYGEELKNLTDGSKLYAAYTALKAAVADASTEEIDIKDLKLTRDQISTVVFALAYNCPEYFWFTGEVSIKAVSLGGGEPTNSAIIPKYLFEASEITTAKTVFNSKVDEILESIDADADDYTKEKAVHDYLIENVTYDLGTSYDQSAYSAIVNKTSVCAGYAKSFKILCNKLGLECMYVTGVAYQNGGYENHAWNKIKINGEYYNVDVTWDDPVISSMSEEDKPRFYSYFNVSDEKFTPEPNPVAGVYTGITHVVGSDEYYKNLPACTSMTYNYYTVNSDLLSIADGEAGSITKEEAIRCMLNPRDGVCRVYGDDSSELLAIYDEIRTYARNISDLGFKVTGTLSLSPSRLISGHELIFTLNSTPGVAVYGEISYDGDASDMLTVDIRDENGVSVYKKEDISGLGASYIAYGLADGTYTINYKYAGGIEQSRTIELTASQTPSQNRVKVDLTLSYGVVRSSGANRSYTATATADKLKETLGISKFDTIIVAYGHGFADALAGSYLAAAYNAPILLVHKSKTHAETTVTLDYIKDNLQTGGKIYVLGGESVVTPEVYGELESISSNIERLSGQERYDTNLAILEEAKAEKSSDTLIVCTGRGYADALSASALGLPIMLLDTKKDELTRNQKNFLDSNSFSKVYVIGGTSAVSDKIKEAVRTELGIDQSAVIRISGVDRYETSVKIAEEFFAGKTLSSVTIATGRSYPDGLTGGSLAYAMETPLILVYKNADKYMYADAFVENKGVTCAVVFGGTSAVADEVVNAIMGK